MPHNVPICLILSARVAYRLEVVSAHEIALSSLRPPP